MAHLSRNLMQVYWMILILLGTTESVPVWREEFIEVNDIRECFGT